MHYYIERKGPWCLIIIEESTIHDMDLPNLEWIIEDSLKCGDKKIALLFQETVRFYSSMLTILAKCLKKIDSKASIAVVHPNEQVGHTMAMVGMNKLAKFAQSVDQLPVEEEGKGGGEKNIE